MTNPTDALNAVYRERAQLVAALSKVFPASLEVDPNEPDWPVCIIDLPTGQVSWHCAPGDLEFFQHLPRAAGRVWDKHDDVLKYERLNALPWPQPILEQFLFEIGVEAWGRDLPTVRLARLIAGEQAALSEPCTPAGTSGDPFTDAEQAVLTAAHAYAAAMRAEEFARTLHKQTQGFSTQDALLVAEDTTTEAHSAMVRAVRGLPASQEVQP